MKRLLVVALLSSRPVSSTPLDRRPRWDPPPQGGFGPVAGGPPPGGGGMTAGGVDRGRLQLTTALRFRGDIGGVFQISCPANCGESGAAVGHRRLHRRLRICRAAIHAGLISPAGGVVAVRLEPGRPAYRGSVRNGIAVAATTASYPKSYVRPQRRPGRGVRATAARRPAQYPPPPPAQYPPPPPYAQPAPAGYAPPPMQAIEAGCSFNAGQLRGDDRRAVTWSTARPAASTPAAASGAPTRTPPTHGVCRAAIHAGLITDAGGNVVVTLDPGRPAYRGSVRNGVRSSDYGNTRRASTCRGRSRHRSADSSYRSRPASWAADP